MICVPLVPRQCSAVLARPGAGQLMRAAFLARPAPPVLVPARVARAALSSSAPPVRARDNAAERSPARRRAQAAHRDRPRSRHFAPHRASGAAFVPRDAPPVAGVRQLRDAASPGAFGPSRSHAAQLAARTHAGTPRGSDPSAHPRQRLFRRPAAGLASHAPTSPTAHGERQITPTP
jgi:hypothetical protein